MRLGAVFDGDDTLWVTEPLYDDARATVRGIVASSGLDGDKWEELERRTDVVNVNTMGHSVERYPASCIQAYRAMCEIEGHWTDPSIEDRIRRAAESVFQGLAPVVPNARVTLERLRGHGVRLALLTKGDPDIQNRRLDGSGLRDLFDVIEIVSEKSPSVIRAVVSRLGVDLGSAWLIGNSVRSDIVPAVTAGLRTIWIKAHVWEYELAANHRIDERVVRAQAIDEVPDLVLT